MKKYHSNNHHYKSTKEKRKIVKKGSFYFIILGTFSVVWFLLRVIPKPSRITYPCQRAAAANAVAFLTWLFGILISGTFFKKAVQKLKISKIGIGVGLLMLALMVGVSAMLIGSYDEIQAAAKRMSSDIFTPPEPANQPFGEAIGIFPGRVTWAHNPSAVLYNPAEDNGFWWEDQNTDPDKVDKMFSESLDAITGATTAYNAWDILFRDTNKRKGVGDIGYTPGDKISIKVNLVMGLTGAKEKANHPGPVPQLLMSLVKSLIDEVGVPGNKITVYDASVRIPDYIMDPFRNSNNDELRNIRFVGNPKFLTGEESGRYIAAEGDLNAPINFADTTVVDVFWVKSVTEADYLINLANLKGHSMAGVTLCAKNLYGSIFIPTASPDIWTNNNYLWGFGPNNRYDSNGNIDMHGGLHRCAAVHEFYFNSAVGTLPQRDYGTYNYLVDLLGHPQIRNKTLLNIVDAFYGGYQQDKISKFESFDNQYTASLFMSQDVIALESVCLDFLRSEPTNKVNVYGNVGNWLHESALIGSPPSGLNYNPGNENEPPSVLGVHEHWNNPEEKAYTRNLGTGTGIELYQVQLPVGVESRVNNSDEVILQSVIPNPFVSEINLLIKLDKTMPVKLTIINQSGNLVKIILDSTLIKGEHVINWDGTSLKSGIYVCRLDTEDGHASSIKLVKH